MHGRHDSRPIGDAILPRTTYQPNDQDNTTYKGNQRRISQASSRSSILELYDGDSAGGWDNRQTAEQGGNTFFLGGERGSSASFGSSTLEEHWRGSIGGDSPSGRRDSELSRYFEAGEREASVWATDCKDHATTSRSRSRQSEEASFYESSPRSSGVGYHGHTKQYLTTFQSRQSSHASYYDTRARSRSRSRSLSRNHNDTNHSISTEKPDPNPDPESSSHKYPKSIPLRGILFEISSLVCAAVSLLVLIAVLRVYDDKPASDWTFGITLNAILSVVSNLFRGSLLIPVAQGISQFCWVWYVKPRPLSDVCDYDSASRGPLGSLRLLWTVRFRHVAAVGAIITLAAMTLDPFFQQSVCFHTRAAVDPKQKSYAVAAHTWGASEAFSAAAAAAADRKQAIPFEMQLAISNGLRSSDTLAFPDPPHSCPSGNCTWDPYATLALNARCVDITSHVKLACTNNQTYGDVCVIRAPGDRMLEETIKTSVEHDAFSMQCAVFPESMDAGLLQPYTNLAGFLTICQWAKVKDVDPELFLIKPTSTVEAGRCAFYLAVNKMRSIVKKGIYSEEKLAEYHLLAQEQPPTKNKNPSSKANTKPYQIQQVGSATPDPNSKPAFTAAQTKLENDTYTLPYHAWLTLANNFNGGFFNSKVNLASWDKKGSPLRYMLYRSENITRAMHGIAEYVTTAIRANATNQLQQRHRNGSLFAAEEAVIGSVWVEEQFISVQWAWLTLPIVLLALTIAFLAAAYWESRRLRVGLWQSSPLTLLFHARMREGVGLGLEQRFEELGTEDAMRDVAKGLYARIPVEERGVVDVYDKGRYSDAGDPDPVAIGGLDVVH